MWPKWTGRGLNVWIVAFYTFGCIFIYIYLSTRRVETWLLSTEEAVIKVGQETKLICILLIYLRR